MKYIISLHIIYLCMLPIAGGFAVLPLDYGSYTLRFAGWIPGVTFTVVLLTQYRITSQKLKAVVIIGIVPLELIFHVFYFKESIGMFFIEACFIELLSLIAALTIAMMIYKPSGLFGVFIGIALSAIVLFGYGTPLYRVYVTEGYHYIWWIILAGILLSGIWSHLQIFLPQARTWSDKDSVKLPSFIFNDDDIYISSPFEDKELMGPILLYIFIWIVMFWTPFSSIFITPPAWY